MKLGEAQRLRMATSETPHIRRPEEIVMQFIRAMHAWSAIALSRHRSARNDPGTSKEVFDWSNEQEAAVISQFCTPKRRKYGLAALGKEYDPAKEQIIQAEQVTASKAHVYTHSTSEFEMHKRYALLKKHGLWLIDNVYWKMNPDEDWTRGIL